MKTASNLLLVQDGKALAICRRDDPTKWGLPGGKVDPGESSVYACLREAFEETGLRIYEVQVEPIVCMRSTGDVDYWTTTYLYVGDRINEEDLKVEEGLQLKWLTLSELADPAISPFAEYNKTVEQAYAVYTKE